MTALKSIYFPRFSDEQQEIEFVVSVIDKHNRKHFTRIWLLACLLISSTEIRSLTYYYKDMSSASMVVFIGWMLKFLLVQVLWLLRFDNILPVSSDTLIGVGSLGFALVALFSDWWRVGAIFMGDGNYLFARPDRDDLNEHRNDKQLLMTLITVAVLTTSTFYVRATRSILVTGSLPFLYIALSLPHGLCPNSPAVIWTDAGFLLVILTCLWASQRLKELQLRDDWMRVRKLSGEVRKLATVAKVKADTPDNRDGPTGSWVAKWVGPHAYSKLEAVKLPATQQALINQSSRTTSNASLLTSLSMSKVIPKKTWLVNATHFDMTIMPSQSPLFVVEFPAFSFVPTTGIVWDDELELRARNSYREPEYWKMLPSDVHLVITAADWLIDGDYDDKLVRLALPTCDGGMRLGSLKLIRGPNALVVAWSPPAEMRGMPIRQFESFLQEVINEPSDWSCPQILEDGTTGIVIKSQGDESRNMYDACDHMPMRAACRVDASYAELETEFGPPDIFGSHVWAEEAGNTLRAIRSFITRVETDRMIGKTSRSHSDVFSKNTSVKSEFVAVQRRIWFCTCCNNQTRVQEELGTDVSISPFARVIKSQHCSQLAVISPFLALSRKWCNFEFALGHSEGKDVMLVTPSGIIQEGQVAPKILYELTKMLHNFSCEAASCTSRDDEKLIDAAVFRMGGSEKLDTILKDTFRSAIEEAHSLTSKALQQIDDQPAYLPSPRSDIVWLWL